MHRMICFVLNIFKRLYISIYIKSHLLMKKLVSPLFFSPVFDILGLVFLYLLLTQILWTLKRKKIVCLSQWKQVQVCLLILIAYTYFAHLLGGL